MEACRYARHRKGQQYHGHGRRRRYQHHTRRRALYARPAPPITHARALAAFIGRQSRCHAADATMPRLRLACVTITPAAIFRSPPPRISPTCQHFIIRLLAPSSSTCHKCRTRGVNASGDLYGAKDFHARRQPERKRACAKPTLLPGAKLGLAPARARRHAGRAPIDSITRIHINANASSACATGPRAGLRRKYGLAATA